MQGGRRLERGVEGWEGRHTLTPGLGLLGGPPGWSIGVQTPDRPQGKEPGFTRVSIQWLALNWETDSPVLQTGIPRCKVGYSVAWENSIIHGACGFSAELGGAAKWSRKSL